jgi:hypothetical protein
MKQIQVHDRNETARIRTCVDANQALEGISTTNKRQVSATIVAMINKNTVPVANGELRLKINWE